MILEAITAAFRGTGRRLRPAALGTPAQTRWVLSVMRSAADRTGQPLSVVVFRPRTRSATAATWEVFGRELPPRLRATDSAGWLDAHRIAAILPFTPTAGAWKVAEDICRLFPATVPQPLVEVLTYPSGDLEIEWGARSRGGDPFDLLAGGSINLPMSASDHTPVEVRHPGAREDCRATPLESEFHRCMPVFKRAVDVLGAGLGLLILLPALPVVALAVKLSSPGPLFFKQRRAGWGGRPFLMWKFRTMVADAEARKAELMALNEQDGPAFKIKRDPRVTTVGRFLRTTSIDELPQLWNVLMGDMSLVGPRPLPVAEAERCEQWQRRRLDVVPGLTCIWQVRGRSAVTFDEWVRMDLEYIERQSLAVDLGLIAQTVPTMVRRKGG